MQLITQMVTKLSQIIFGVAILVQMYKTIVAICWTFSETSEIYKFQKDFELR